MTNSKLPANSQQSFRRPASLSWQQQESIPSGIDPAVKHQLAHDSAAALLAGTRQFAATVAAPEVRQNLINLVRTEGLGDIAALWSEADPISLPGALWRLYVLHTWVDHDPGTVKDRVELGKQTVPGLAYLAGFPEPPAIDTIKGTLNEILAGAFTGDLGMALRRAAAVTMLAAFGTVQLESAAEAAKSTEYADVSLATIEALDHRHTLAASRLLKLGEQLEAAAIRAEKNQLY